MKARQITGPDAHHGEGPVWSDTWRGLRWVDMLAGDVMTLDGASGEVTRTHVGSIAAVIRPRAGGGVVVALEHSVAVADDELHDIKTLAKVSDDPRLRFNDGGCDPDGRFYCGSMAHDASQGAGTLYCFSKDGSVSVTLESVTVSNGFGFSPDGMRAYYIDSATQHIDIFDYEPEHGLTFRRPWVEISVDAGIPDGLAVDSENGVWVAMFGGSAVRRYDDSGHLDAIVELPVSQVTACAFGGDTFDSLYVTTSQQGIDPGSQPAAGSVFMVDASVRGMPPLPFGR